MRPADGPDRSQRQNGDGISMDSKYYGLIEMGLVFGLVLAWGFWELYALRRDRKKTDADRKPDSDMKRP